MADYGNDLKLKMDEIFGFNLSRSSDGVSYDFGQYKLNQIYRPLVNYFINEFSEYLTSIDEGKANEEITLFLDFFKLYFFQGDFGYFKNKYSSFKYKIPYGADYSGNDTELRWASKDCYYVKTSDVVNSIDVQIPRGDLSTDDISLKFFKKSQANDNGDYILSVESEEIIDEDENLIGYNIFVYNWDESKNKKLEDITKKLEELQIQAGGGLINSIKEFLNKWGRDYFIHKNLKEFLTGELEWYLYQVLKGDTKGRISVLEIKNEIEKIKAQHPDDENYIIFKTKELYDQINSNVEPTIYQDAYIRCINFINILSDLENFKLKLWTKKRKAIKQEYCISLGKIKELETLIPKREHILSYIFENEKQIQEWKDLGMSDNPSVDDDSLVVDTKNFEGEQRQNLINLVSEDKIIGKLYNSENYQALGYMGFDNGIQTIYIDPPYNTDNDDFSYKDGYKDSTRLSMMESRLELAKEKLDDNGVIFISIDKHEIAQLKVLCGKVFGEKNYIEIFNREKTQSPSNLSSKSKERIEYVLCYSKSINNDRFIGIKKDNPNDNPLIKKQNPFKVLKFPKDKIICTINEDCFFKAGEYGTKVNQVFLKKDVMYKDGKFEDDLELEGRFIWTQENLESELNKNTKVIFKGKSLAPRYDKAEYLPEVPPNLIDTRWGVGTNDNATEELANTVGRKKFTNPKPVSLIEYLLSFKKSSVSLDFFAGSGTTGHAVMNINKKNEENRKFIEVELGKYFDDVTLIRTKKIQYSQNWKDEKALDNDGTQGIIEYVKLNQYEDWFLTNGYLSLLDDDIKKLSELENVESISQILSPLMNLKDRIYNIDDELPDDQLLEISNNK